MKKVYVVVLFILSSTMAYSQRSYEASLGLSPAFPIGELSDYVKSGLGFNLAVQTGLKDRLKAGVELSFHKLKDNYDYNSFLSVSGYLNNYFDSNYKIDQITVLPYLGLGLGLYSSQYYNDFFGEEPSTTGLVLSPRAGIRLDLEKVYLTGEGRLHIGTGNASSFLPLVLGIGVKF